MTIWGTFPTATIESYVQQINAARAEQLQISYVQIAPADFNTTFINAYAKGQGPDIVLLQQDMLSRYSDKVVPIPYNVLPQRTFMDTYVEGTELYLGSQGVNAILPWIDPLVMYWNRDTFTNAGLPSYPQYWDEFPALVPKLTVKDGNGNIDKSAISFGEFANVPHARDIRHRPSRPRKSSDGLDCERPGFGSATAPPTAASSSRRRWSISSPSSPISTSPSYSWNRGLPSADSDFLSGNLAVYFGFASEINALRNKNPNLNFDAAPLPQIRNGSVKAVYGTIYGLSIVRSSSNPTNAYNVIQVLADPSNLSTLVGLTYLPPARRDMIAAGTTDPYLSIFYASALVTKSWDDVDPTASNAIFSALVQSVTSGAKRVAGHRGRRRPVRPVPPKPMNHKRKIVLILFFFLAMAAILVFAFVTAAPTIHAQSNPTTAPTVVVTPTTPGASADNPGRNGRQPDGPFSQCDADRSRRSVPARRILRIRTMCVRGATSTIFFRR